MITDTFSSTVRLIRIVAFANRERGRTHGEAVGVRGSRVRPRLLLLLECGGADGGAGRHGVAAQVGDGCGEAILQLQVLGLRRGWGRLCYVEGGGRFGGEVFGDVGG